MKHGVWFDEEKQILRIQFVGHFNSTGFQDLCDECQRCLNGYTVGKAIIDFSDIESFPDEDVRKRLVEQLGKAGVERVALVGNRPEVKVVGVILLEHLAKYAKTRFFAEEEEALEWLQKSTSANENETCGEAKGN